MYSSFNSTKYKLTVEYDAIDEILHVKVKMQSFFMLLSFFVDDAIIYPIDPPRDIDV